MQLRLFTLILFSVFLHSILLANKIEGRVKDSTTGELLTGCSIYLEEQNIGTTSGLDGTFVIRNVQAGNYTLACSYISYKTYRIPVQVSKEKPVWVEILLAPDYTDLNEILVYGHIDKSTESSARASESNAANILNVMSAKAIELSPDLTVANVIQRMSGVTTEKNSSGEAQYAVLRGMDKRYNYTLVNGVKISSPDNKHRYVPLNIFPSELLDRVEVSKSLTADMEGDATGGVINMVMKDAPAKKLIQANAALGYNSWFFNQQQTTYDIDNVLKRSPRELNGKDYKATLNDFPYPSGKLTEKQALPNGTIGFAMGNRFARNRAGFIVAGNYQNIQKGYSSIFFEDEMIQTEHTVRLTGKKERSYSEQQMQYGLHAKTDFRLSPRNKLDWYTAFIGSRTMQVRETTSLNFKLNYDPANGYEDLSYQTRIRTQLQQIFTSTLQGNHLFSEKFTMNWSAVYSFAGNRLPELTQIKLDNLRQDFVDNIYADADGSTRRWEYNTDRDYSFLLHTKYENNLGAWKMQIKVGGIYRDKRRRNHYVNYRFKPLNGDQRYITDFTTLDEISWTLYTPSGSVGPLEYDATEQIAAAYTNAVFIKPKLYLSGGVRVEYTNQGYLMYFPNAGDSPEGKQKYPDILPSAQMKYMPSTYMNWKASYFRSINRPGFFEIVPYQIVNEEYNEFGNKNMKRATIDNLDFRWEYFPKENEQLMVGLFYKNIQNPIEYAYFTINYRQYGYGPVNLGNAQNLGAEIDFIKFFRQFGIKANYTYTHSTITTSKAHYGQDENGNYKRMFADQTRPLVGQAAHVANVALMYKSIRNGIDVQLAAAYTGEKILIASHYLNSDYWQAPSLQADASAEKRFKHGISVFAKVNNMINTLSRQYIKTSNAYNLRFPVPEMSNAYTLIREDIYGMTFLAGIRWKL